MRYLRSALFFGGVSQQFALECGDVDTMMLNSLDEDPLCSVSLLQRRAETVRKHRAVDVEFSSIDASEDASLAVQELSDAIGKLVSVETTPRSTGTSGDDKDEFFHHTHGLPHTGDVRSQIKAQAQQEASHAMKAMEGAFAELLSQHGRGEAVDGRDKNSATILHNSHHKNVVLAQMSASETNPPPLVFSWEGSPLTSDFDEATAQTSLHIANESSNGNQTSDKIVPELITKVNENTNETKQVPNSTATLGKSNSTVSSDKSFMNDTVFAEASSFAPANASSSKHDTVSVANNSGSVMAPQAGKVSVAVKLEEAHPSVMVEAVEDIDGTVVANNGTRLVANDEIAIKEMSESVSNQTVGSNTSMAGVVEEVDGTAKASNDTRVVANQTVEKDGDEIAIPAFVFNSTKLAEDLDVVSKEQSHQDNEDAAVLLRTKSALYPIPPDIAANMDKVELAMDHLLNNWVEDVGVDGSMTGLAQVDDKLAEFSARFGKTGNAEKSSHALSEMSVKLASLQSALAKMDSADLTL